MRKPKKNIYLAALGHAINTGSGLDKICWALGCEYVSESNAYCWLEEGSTTESLTVLSRLPDSTTDFAFTSMIAKFGMLMGLLILALYGCIAKWLTDTIRTTKDQFNKMVSTGTLGLFAIYTIMALLVAFGILATAAYWPFVGYGSMMFWTWCILFGFVLALNRNK